MRRRFAAGRGQDMGETYEVRVQGRFSAVHQLRMPGGSVEPLHGHDWRVEAVFRGPRLDAVGLLVDFEKAAEALRQVLAGLNHANLNTVGALAGGNPTAERVARIIFEQLRQSLGGCPLAAVYVEEAPGCEAGYLAESS